MQKSIFKKYLTLTMITIALSFFTLGAALMTFFGSYWKEEKQTLLLQNAQSVSSVTKKVLESGTGSTLVPILLTTFSQNIDADIFVTGQDGEVFFGNYANSHRTAKEKEIVGTNIMDKIKALKAEEPCYEERGMLDSFYTNKMMTVAVPVYIVDADGKETFAAAVFASTSSSPMNSIQQGLLNIFLLAALPTFLITFGLVVLYSYNMIRPLRNMSVAVRRFGDGDFSVRVPVNSEDEMGHLAVAFNDMANSLSNSEVMRRSFIANVSHELKTPMTTIAGFVDGILDGTIPQEKQTKYLKIVSVEVKRLSRLVKSMLDLSRIDSGEMQIHPTCFDLTKTIFSAMITFEKSIDDKEIEVRGLDEMDAQTVFGDQDLLHQVVYNLIENAVKFTNNGGYISLKLVDSIDRVCVEIENSGPGIEPEDLPMIFDRFYKTDKSRSRDKNGMGLGLFIVKTVIRLHGGDISVMSKMGQYTKFSFFIPKKNCAPERKDYNQSDILDAQIVDDAIPASAQEIPPLRDEGKKSKDEVNTNDR
ncbi:sensor histidine kinase [Scatolibacter rhodanostii]|uniref:sensor histidine kinase n=1 Tax=Scatolibacter rhodanostii TaxID=2014781 RepID=UPI000C068455|nr:HAMP domain-containing sensor histidine kinase [Scatolibacter rhodanostii]